MPQCMNVEVGINSHLIELVLGVGMEALLQEAPEEEPRNGSKYNCHSWPDISISNYIRFPISQSMSYEKP